MSNRKLAGLALALLCGVSGAAGAAGFNADKSKISYDALDMVKIAEEDALTDFKEGKYRFAVGRETAINPAAHGVWTPQADGSLSWTFTVETPDAAHLNFGFNPFHLPAGASLVIRAADGSAKIGPYTDANNVASGQLWTEVLLSPSAVLELTVPAGKQGDVQLNLVKIGQGYRGFGAVAKHCKAGACNMDVACLGPSDPWNNPRRSVAAYTLGGTDTCTGSLVNNTANDRRMLFATATHCGINNDTVAGTIVAYWNYESATCRTPGSSASGTVVPRPSTTSSGARFLAQTANPFAGSAPAGDRSDFTLIEFLQAANPAYNLYWAGWDRRNVDPVCSPPANPVLTTGLCASIHHPGVDEKRITFVEATMQTGNISSATGVHWHPFWDPTPPLLPGIQPPPTSVVPNVTEPGSSGSPLYDANQRLIGVLSGGPSACGSTGANLSDFYGKLAHAWDGLGTPTTAMKSYLDPAGAGTAQFHDGIGQCNQPAAPTNVAAAVNGNNNITVTWTAAAGITKYRVLRSTGACPGTTFAQIAEVDNVTTYADTTVSGGSTYSYKVTSVDTVQPCESVSSACSSATATGVCSLSPTFAGASAAASAGTVGCAVNVNWAAASANCGGGGQMRYNVFRSTTSGFTPSAANAVATCVSGTTYNDNTVLPSTQYHYVVRAEDSSGTGSGVCASGLQDSNTVQKSITPAGPDTNAFFDNVEGGSPGPWTISGTGSVGANFAQVTTQANSPTHSWFVPDPANVSERFLATTAPVAVPNAPGTTFEAYIRYHTEPNYDGTLLEYSLDGGTTWSDILAAQGTVPANAGRFLSGGYNGTMNGAGAFGARTAWHGDFSTVWTRSTVNLADFAGRNVNFRFRFKSDTSVDRPTGGFWIDDIRVYYGSACNAQVDAIFANGFEGSN